MGSNDRGQIVVLDEQDEPDGNRGGSAASAGEASRSTSPAIFLLAIGLAAILVVGLVSGSDSGAPAPAGDPDPAAAGDLALAESPHQIAAVAWAATPLVDVDGREIVADDLTGSGDTLWAVVEGQLWLGDTSGLLTPLRLALPDGQLIRRVAADGSRIAITTQTVADRADPCAPVSRPNVFVSDDGGDTWIESPLPDRPVQLGTAYVRLEPSVYIAVAGASVVADLDLTPTVSPECVAVTSGLPRYSIRGADATSVIALLDGGHINIELESLGVSAYERELWQGAFEGGRSVGFSWALVDDDWVAISPRAENVRAYGGRFVATAAGVQVSSDDAVVWTPVESPRAPVAFSGSASTVMLADSSGWSAVSFDAGLRWLPVSDVFDTLPTDFAALNLDRATFEPVGVIDGFATFTVADEAGHSWLVTGTADDTAGAATP